MRKRRDPNEIIRRRITVATGAVNIRRAHPLTREEVLVMLEAMKNGATRAEIARRYKLDPGFVSRIALGQRWLNLIDARTLARPRGENGRWVSASK